MKVYIVQFFYDYEGYGDPLFVSTDIKKSEKFVMEKLDKKVKSHFAQGVEYNYQEYWELVKSNIIRDHYEIFEMDVVE